MVNFTVAICTYNGAERLPQVLENLRSQVATEQITWEVIVVDNASTDHTAQVVEQYQATWPSTFPLKYHFAAQKGLAFARQSAIQAASGEFVGFLDDDNWPADNWVATAFAFGKAHPRAGAFSGRIQADFEVPPPPNFEPIQAFLAIRDQGSRPCLFEPDHLILPPGAGLVVRRQAWCETAPPEPTLKGRVNGSMLPGEDYEILLHMHKQGWEIWYEPTLQIVHQIPHWRLERSYLVQLTYACGLATCQLRMINATAWQKPLLICKTLGGNLRRIILYSLKHHRQIQQDLHLSCEMAFFWGSFLSPFQYLKLTFSSKNS